MAQATRSLPPKRLAERAQLHRQAVTILAHRRARKAVERELQEQGLKPRYIGCYCRGWRKLPVVGRSSVRYYKCARQADGDCAWRIS
jgi:hypothetical protein